MFCFRFCMFYLRVLFSLLIIVITIMSKCSKVIVFDLDETLGSFVEMGMFWDALQAYFDNKLNNKDFNMIVDLFPELLRPEIENILKYLKKKKRENECKKILIYTNNMGGREWVHKIRSYLEERTKMKLFDQVICAFTHNGQHLELNRTTEDKTYSDLLRCCKLPANTEFCFLDDQMHPEMEHDMIYYIKIKPYVHDFPFETMADRFLQSDYNAIVEDPEDFKDFVVSYMNDYDYTINVKGDIEKEVDRIISKKIMFHLQEFFNSSLQPPKHTINRHTRKKLKDSRNSKSKSKSKTKSKTKKQ